MNFKLVALLLSLSIINLNFASNNGNDADSDQEKATTQPVKAEPIPLKPIANKKKAVVVEQIKKEAPAPIDINALLKDLSKTLEADQKDAIMLSLTLVVDLLKVLGEVFEAKKVTPALKKRLEDLLTKGKDFAIDPKHQKLINFKPTPEQTQIVQKIFEYIKNESGQRAMPEVMNLMVQAQGLTKEKLQESITPEKTANLLAAILDIIAPLIQLQPIFNQVSNLIGEINTKLKEVKVEKKAIEAPVKKEEVKEEVIAQEETPIEEEATEEQIEEDVDEENDNQDDETEI